MKLRSLHTSRVTFHASRPLRRQSGSAVIIVLALIAIMLVYVAANMRTLYNLGSELRLLERKQVQRLKTATQRTNSPPAMVVGTNSLSIAQPTALPPTGNRQ